MTAPIVDILFTVARGTTAVTSYQRNEDEARADLQRIQDAMRTAGLEPDVVLATVEMTTTYADPVPVATT